MIDSLHLFHNQLQKAGVIFAFSGPVSQFVIEGIGETLKHKMELEDAGMNTIQRVFSVFVEQMQNVVNHSADTVTPSNWSDGELRVGTLVVSRNGGKFWLQCGNMVQESSVPILRERLDYLRGLDRDALKALYRDARKSASDCDSKGAGLGFIDIARRASEPIDYQFSPATPGLSFFTITATIGDDR